MDDLFKLSIKEKLEGLSKSTFSSQELTESYLARIKLLDNKLNRIVEITGIPEEMYTSKPLVGVKEKVFETMDEFSSVECDYLIAYVPDIVWGDTLDILSEKL